MEKIKLFVTDKAIEMFFQGKRNVYSKDKKELKQVLELLYKKIGKYEVFSNTTAAVGEKATDRVMNEDITIIFNTLNDFLNCYFPKFYNFKEKFKPVTDRDFLDLSIEMYSFIYCQLYDLEYKEAENQLELMEDPFLSSLLNYKMVKYGAEIFSNLGMEIVGKNKEGYIVRGLEEIDKTKLN